MFKCPVCGKETITFYGLIVHFKIHVNGECPVCRARVCRARVKSISRHLFIESEKDDGHKIAYGLIVHPNKSKFKRKKDARDFAYLRCEVK